MRGNTDKAARSFLKCRLTHTHTHTHTDVPAQRMSHGHGDAKTLCQTQKEREYINGRTVIRWSALSSFTCQSVSLSKLPGSHLVCSHLFVQCPAAHLPGYVTRFLTRPSYRAHPVSTSSLNTCFNTVPQMQSYMFAELQSFCQRSAERTRKEKKKRKRREKEEKKGRKTKKGKEELKG